MANISSFIIILFIVIEQELAWKPVFQDHPFRLILSNTPKPNLSLSDPQPLTNPQDRPGTDSVQSRDLVDGHAISTGNYREVLAASNPMVDGLPGLDFVIEA